jgi:hypothetical protein
MTVERATHLVMLCDSLTKGITELVGLAGERYGLLSTLELFELGRAVGIVVRVQAVGQGMADR